MYKPLAQLGNGMMTVARVASLAREQTENSINTIIAIRDSADVPPNVRLAAANSLLDRGWGRPKEVHVIEGPSASARLRL